MMFAMPHAMIRLLAFTTCLLSRSVGAQSTWAPNQVNTTICTWTQLRAAVVRDTVYMDGGSLWWLPGNIDGTLGPAVSDDNPLGLVYTLNLSTPFNVTQNISAIFKTISKAANGGQANNIAPNYYDGAMLANNDEWFLFGGLLRKTAAFAPPHSDDVTEYQAYQYGVQKDGFQPSFLTGRLSENVTRYIAYGGAANAPSENKAWYFSGMQSPSSGPIYLPTGNNSETAVNVSSSLIVLDMTTQQQEKWSNLTVPELIPGRANPELVWVPVGAQGILVALGGVVYPEFASPFHTSSNAAASKQDSPAFLQTIDIYDIAGDKWYQQPTNLGPANPGPGTLTRGCAVVAPAQDHSSFNIYYYGGYDGLDPKAPLSDDVWALSLPSFTWIQVASGKASHGRIGHKCIMPYPDQMMVIGGTSSQPGGGQQQCLQDVEPIQMFNLSSGTWMAGYDPSVWSNYSVPQTIYAKIGGGATGGATVAAPSPTGWASPELGKVFATPYPTSKLQVYYPYGSAAPQNSTRPDASGGGGGSGVPTYLPILLGVIFGVMGVTIIAILILLWRRRKLLRASGPSEVGTDDSGNRILSWIRGQPEKAPTVTTEESAPLSPSDVDAPVVSIAQNLHPHTVMRSPPMIHEVEDNQLAELPDTSPRAELYDTGLSPVEVINKHTHFASTSGSLNNPSNYSGITQTDHASTLSQSTGQGNGGSSFDPRPDSPALGGSVPVVAPSAAAAAASPTSHVASGVSEVSERDRAHLRQISDTTVSSVNTGLAAGGSRVTSTANPPEGAAALAEPSADSPLVSPPSADMHAEGPDYLSARQPVSPNPVSPNAASATSPLRRSIFHEDHQAMDDNKQ